jgi:hypothetical protein
VATLSVAAQINGTDYGTVGTCGVTALPMVAVSFGAYADGDCHFDIRDIKVGTGGYGSSDLFAPALTSLAEFSGVFDADGSIVASGGVLSVDGTSDHYAYFRFPIGQVGSVAIEFGLRVRGGDNDPDYCDIWNDISQLPADGSNLDGIFNSGGAWSMNGCGGNFGDGPSGDPTWDLIDLMFTLAGVAPPVPPAIHIAS